MSSDMNSDLMELAGGWHLLAAKMKERGRPFSDIGRGLERAATELDQVLDTYHVGEPENPTHFHRGMVAHDGYATHSHEIRSDHLGVPRRRNHEHS